MADCGNTFNGGSKAATDGCNMACSGNSTEVCGGPNRLTVFTSGNAGGSSSSGPSVNPGPAGWGSLGCYTDSTGARTLTTGVAVTGGASAMTVALCTSACKSNGFKYAGVEYASECYCGNSFANGGGPASDGSSGCSMTCAGNATEYCGGPNRLNVYQAGVSAATSAAASGGSAATSTAAGSAAASSIVTTIGNNANPTSASDGPGTITTSTTSGLAAVTSGVSNGLPNGWTYKGCFVDSTNGRILPTQVPDSSSLTIETCIASCKAAGYSVAGAEYSTQCFCGDEVIEGGTLASQDSDCGMACGGNANEKCGGPSRMSIYSNDTLTIIQPPVAQNTSLPGKWQYVGCLT